MQYTFDFRMQIEPLTKIEPFFPRENCEKEIEPIYFGDRTNLFIMLWKIASIKYKQLKCILCIDKLIHAKISKNKNLSIEPFYPRVAIYINNNKNGNSNTTEVFATDYRDLL